MVVIDWLRRWPLVRGQSRKLRRQGQGTVRLRTLLSRQVELLEDRSLLVALQPDLLSLTSSGGDFGPFQVTTEPLVAPDQTELSAATFAGRSLFQTAGVWQTTQGDDFVAVDVSQTYALSGWAKSGDEFGQRFDPANCQSFGIAEYDSDHLAIQPVHVLKFAGAADTTLSAALNPGDTQIHLTSAAGWSNSGGAAATTRAIAWYGYTNSTGQTYADFSYTRNVAIGGANGLWNAGSVNGVTNTINLSSPWSGPALVAGAAVRNATGGSEFQFLARNNQPVPGDWSWTLSANTFGGGEFANGAESANRFRPGTAFIKPVLSANEQGTLGNFVTWRDVAVRPVAAGTTAQELAQRVIDLSVVTGGDQRHELSLTQDAKPLDAFVWTQELVRVNTSEKYDLTAWSINSREVFDRPMGFASLDVDHKLIHPLHVSKFGNAVDTHLAATLSPGATSILVTDATGWSNSPLDSAQTRALAWYGYTDSTGHTYPDFSYTRNVAFDFDRGLWGDGGIAFDAGAGAYRITLTAPWAGPTLPAGAAVRNATSGELFNQFTIHSTEPTYGWQEFGGTIGGGTWQNGRRDEASFRPGTAFIQPTFAGGEPLAWRDIHIAPQQASFFDGPQSVTFSGQSVITASQSMSLLQADQLIPIDLSRGYVLSASALRGAAVGDGSPVNDQHTLGFTSFDSDGNEILPIHVTRYASATDTTLAAALNVGDTTIRLTNATGWSNLGPADTRGVAWFGYSNSAGQTYPNYSYTRNVAVDRVNGLWDIGAINGNTITLRAPWSGPSLAAGTALRNAADGERLNVALLNRGTIPNQWTDFSTTVSGSWVNGQPQADAFRPGTAFIRPAALINAVTLSGDDVVSLRNVSVSRSDVPSGTVTADANHRVAVIVDALANDPLVASTALRIISVTSPKYGSATIVTGGGAAGQDVVQYLSAPWFVGLDSFQYTAQRVDNGAVFTSTITINVTGTNLAQDVTASAALTLQGQQVVGNAPPVAADEFNYYAFAYQTSVGQTLVVDGIRWSGLLTNEYRAYGISGGQPLNSGALTVRLLSGPEHGTLNLKYDGMFEYSPNPGFVGTDVFRYEVFDGLHADATVAAVNVRKSEQDLLQRRMKDVVTAFFNFHNTNGRFTVGGSQPTYFDALKNPYLSWRVHLLPYLGYAELYNQFHLNEPWNSANNLPLLDKMPDVFRTPGDSAATNTTRFQTLTGPGSAYFWRRDSSGYLVGPQIRDYYFQDSLENTLLLLLAGEDKGVPWTQPVDLNFDPSAPVVSLGSLPSGKIDGVMAGGAVISLHTDIAPATFLALATMDGHEVIDADTLRRQEKLREGGVPAVQAFDASLADSRLGTLGLAMHLYYDTFSYFPVANNPAWFDAQGKPKVSWRVHLLPYLGQENLYNQFHLDEPWDSANNLPLLSQMPDIFRSLGDAADSVTTRLVTFTGVDAPFLRAKTSGNYYGPKINHFVDGVSNTILIAEAGADRSVLWTKPDDIAFDINQPLAGLGSLADGRIRMLLADGSRLSLGADVSTTTFQALVTPNGHDFADGSTLRSREELRTAAAQRIDADVMNRFKEIGLAMHNFHDTYKKFPIEDLIPAYFDAQGKPKLSWRVWILPFMDQQSLFERFHLDEAWDSPNNLPLLDQMPDVFRHPGDPTDSTTTRVQEFTGPGAPFLSVFLNGRYQSLKINQITDGTSNTLMAVETGPDKAVPWTKPDDIPFDPANPFAAMGQLGEFFVALFADAVTKRISTSISASLLKAYVTHKGGEFVGSNESVTDPAVTYGLTITPASGVLSAVEGQLATFDVVLNKAPTTDVVLTIASSASLVAAVDRTSLRFTSANWNVPQRVTVQAVDDFVVDESQTATITVAVDDANSDNNYDPVSDRTLSMTALDNDVAGFQIAPTGGSTIVTESGSTDTFSVVLTAQPSADVVIDLVNPDPGEVSVNQSVLTFTPSNWNTPQTLSVTGVDDASADGTQTTTLSVSVNAAASAASFAFVPPQGVAVATLDNETAGIVVALSGGETTVLESAFGLPEARDTFTVRLTAPPESNVVIAVASSDTLQVTVSTSMLTFTPANWSSPQTVTVYSVNNGVVDGTRSRFVTLVAVAEQSPASFATVQQTVAVTITDDELPAIHVTPSNTFITVSENGTSDTFTVKLGAQPLSPVVVEVVNNYASYVSVNQTSLTFTPDDWNVPQSVTVTGVDDPWANGDTWAVIRMSVLAQLSDSLWAATQDAHCLVQRLSNDLAGFTITQTGGSSSVTEGVLGDSFSVKLTGQPLTNVVLRIVSADTGEVVTNRATLTFGQSDWNVAQTVQLNGVADLIVDGTQTTLVTLSVDDVASNDFFDAVADQSFSVTTTDSDVAGFTVTPSGGSTSVSESGTADTVSVVLTRGPLTDVVLRISSSDTGEAIATSSLTFTPANWNTPQIVTVTGVDDALVDGNQTSTLTVSVDDAASDNAFDPLADRIVSVVTLDDDAPGFTILVTDGATIVAESGTIDTFAVVLNNAPLSNVVIQIGSHDLGEATTSPATLTFTPANWNTPQIVTVTGIDDTLADGDQTTSIVLTVVDASSDNAFDSLPDQTVLATTLDVNHAPNISDVGGQTTNQNTATAPIAFTVGDVESAAGNLIVSASSSDQTLVPNGSFVLGGSGVNRTVVVTPAAGKFGSVTITLTVSDGADTTSDTFVLTINAAPTISDLADSTTNEDTATAAIPFVIGDAETPVGNLTVSATSSNTTLVPNGNLALIGNGANRSLVITPAANANGSATITVTVSDGSASTSDTFMLTVNSVNDAPTISTIASQSTNEDTATSAIPFTVGDQESATSLLTVTATSSNTALISASGLQFGGSGADRTIRVTPAANQSGSATITLAISDGVLITTSVFELTVMPVNDAPTLNPIADQNSIEDTPVSVSAAISDLESSSDNLVAAATSSNTTLIPNANLVFSGSGVNRTLTATPTPNAFGTTTITITVSDGVASSSRTFLLTVAAVNDAPAISDIGDLATNEDTATIAIPLTVGDLESAAGSLTVTATSSDTTLVPNANLVLGGAGAGRTLTITPAANRNGSATITVTVSDGSLTTSDTFVLTVSAVNDVPTISDLSDISILEDIATPSLEILIGDVETATSDLSVTVTSSNVTLVPADHIALGGSGANRTLILSPAANRFGSATITVAVGDGVTTTSDTFVLTVSAVNDAPTISGIVNQAINEDAVLTSVPFTIGDLETPASDLIMTALSSNTSLVPNANIVFGGSGTNRTLSVTPAANQFGSARITITVSDGIASVTDSFELVVNAVNDAPIISNILNQSVNEDASTSNLPFTIGDLETVAGNLTVTATSSDQTLLPDSGIVLEGSGANRTFRLTPAANRFGSTTVTVTVSDGEQSATDTFVLTVNGVNDAPAISSIGSQTTFEDTPLPSLEFTIGDLELPAGALTVTATSSSTVLLPAANLVLGGSGSQRTLTITPASNLSGTANVTITVSDGQASASTVFAVTVTPVNDAPVISDIAPKSTDEDTATPAISFVISDVETSAAALVVTATSSVPQLVPNVNLVLGGSGSIRTITAIPAANQTGVAIITVTVSDGLATTTDSFELTVAAINDRPTLTDLPNQTILEDTATAAIPFSIGDVETSASELIVTVTSSNGTLVPSEGIVLAGSGAERTLIVIPAANQFGTSTMTVRVSDGSATITDSFLLTVNGVNDPPSLADIADQSTDEDVALTLPLNIADSDTAASNLKVTVTSSDTTLIPAAGLLLSGTGTNRSLKITPAANRFGLATITVKVSDGTATVTDSFMLTVNSVNDRPTMSDITNKSTNEDTATSPISFTIGDLETPATSLTVTAASSNTTLLPNAALILSGTGASRTLKAVPAANQFGSTTISVAVSDGSITTTDTFVLTVNPINDAPTISNIPNQSTRRNTQTPAIPFTIGDLETTATSLTVSGSSSNTTLVPNANILFGGSGSNRTLRITPAANRTGTATVTVRVRDGSLTATDTFVLTVTASTASLRSASLVAQEFTSVSTVRETSIPISTATISAPIREPLVAASLPSLASSSAQTAPVTTAIKEVSQMRTESVVERLQPLDLAFHSTDWIEWL